MNPYEIIEKYYYKNSKLYHILVTHNEQVRNKALQVVDRHPELNADRDFIEEAATLHDIGIFLTNAPQIECYGELPYICHGYLGHDILKQEGFPRHALVCERHTGCGLSLHNIIEKNLPIPKREMLPVSIEEQIICYADKFYSKTKLDIEAGVEKVISKMERYGLEQKKRFLEWHKKFG